MNTAAIIPDDTDDKVICKEFFIGIAADVSV
jgi:hypothetical protein